MAETPEEWTPEQEALFSSAVRFAGSNQPVFIPPGCPPIEDQHWQAITWNIAYFVVTKTCADEKVEIVDSDSGDTIAEELDAKSMQ